MVAPQYQGKVTPLENFLDFPAQDAYGPGDLRQVFRERIKDPLLLLRLDSEIPFVVDRVSEFRQAGANSGDSDRGRAHVEAAPAGTQIHRESYGMDSHI